MSNDRVYWWLATVFFCLASGLFGWIFAHGTVATECRRLGAFYVGTTTFDCSQRGDK